MLILKKVQIYQLNFYMYLVILQGYIILLVSKEQLHKK